jgi:fructokinase
MLHGRLHPEQGHTRIPLDGMDEVPGSCPVHGNCLEGLASGRAIAERYGTNPHELDDAHPAWPLVSDYVASGVANIILTLSPRRVVIGGGVSRRLIWSRLYRRLDAILNGYPIEVPSWADFVMPPRLVDSGALGAIALAQQRGFGGQTDALMRVRS